jgi:hypothetical protein
VAVEAPVQFPAEVAVEVALVKASRRYPVTAEPYSADGADQDIVIAPEARDTRAGAD